MKPVYQTKFGRGDGNCLQACVATLLDKPLEEIPHFIESGDWFHALEFFMQAQGYATILDDCVVCYPDGAFYLAWGYSPRGIMHSVVYWNGTLAHDPHPDGGDVVAKQIVYFVETFNRMNA